MKRDRTPRRHYRFPGDRRTLCGQLHRDTITVAADPRDATCARCRRAPALDWYTDLASQPKTEKRM